MSEADAEWFTPEDPIRPPFVTPVTRRPTRRPRTRPPVENPVTRRPRYPGGRRTPRPLPLNPNEATEKTNDASLSQAALISITVISCLLLVAIVLALVYFLVIRKRKNKPKTLMEQKENFKRDDYSIRIEDVAHRDIDDSDELYVNTKDLHRLATSLRSKNSKNPPLLPSAFSSNETNLEKKADELMSPSYGSLEQEKPKVPVATVNPIANTHTITRKAPSPPKVSRSESQEQLVETTISKTDVSSSSDELPTKPKSRNASPPKLVQKPNVPPPPAPGSNKSMQESSQAKTELPRLNVKLKPPLLKKPNQPVTPDTGVSYLPDDSETNSPSASMSIKARRALIENALAKK